MTFIRDLQLFPVRGMMQLRSGPVEKHANLDSERGLRIEAIFARWERRLWTILAPFSLQNRPGGHENDVGRVTETAEGVPEASRGRLGSSRTAFWRANGKRSYVGLT